MERNERTQEYENIFYGYILLLYLCGVQMDLLHLISARLQVQFIMYAVLLFVTFLCVSAAQWLDEDKKYIFLIPLLCSLFLVIFGGDGIRRGLLDLADEILLRWNTAHQDGLNLLLSGQVATIDRCAAILLCVLLIMSLLLKAGNKMVGPAASGILLIFLVGNLLLKDTQWHAVSFMITASVGFTFFYKKRGQRIMLSRAFWITVMTVVLSAFGLLCKGDFKTTKLVRNAAKQKTEDIRYGKNPLPEGNLYKAHTMCQGDQITLDVTSEEIKTLYLRGFEGGAYKGGVWKELRNSSYGYEYSGMLQWLHNNGFHSAREYASYMKNCDKSTADNHIKVKNIGADRQYIYTPYSVNNIRGANEKEKKDMGYRSTAPIGTFQYAFTEKSGNLPGELLVADSWVKKPYNKKQKKYMDAEEVYRKFVYDTYCKVNYSLEPLITARFYDNAKSKDMTGVYAITGHIREMLRSYAVYKENPSAVPEDSDPVYWFLTEGREGNSALFASVGVLAFRSFGIPARYAEGYLVTKEQLEQNQGKATLTHADSHAWVEVYLDGMGWVDIDVTPGFYYEEFELMQMVQKPQGVRMAADMQDDDKKDGSENGSGGGKPVNKKTEHNYIIVFIGGLVFCMMLFTAFVVYMELRRYFRYRRWIKQIKQAEDTEKSSLYCEIIFYEMEKLGIQAGIGWRVPEVETVLRQYVSSIYPGEFVLVNGLLEKGIFSGKTLSNWEFRALDEFTKKLLFDAIVEKSGIVRYLKIRYQ